MRITFDISGIDAATQELVSRFSARRLNAATATALTRTALDVREAVKREMRAVFDRPTPYTMGSLYVRPAAANKLWAETYFKDDRAGSGTPATYYIVPEVEGGPRRVKRFEASLQAAGLMPKGWLAMPAAGARLDAYGNVSKGQIIQILSQLRVRLTAGYERKMSFDSRKQIAAQRTAGGRFFAVKKGNSRLLPGVYQREFMGRNITPIFIFVSGAGYRPRLDFYRVARTEVEARLPVHVARALGDSAARLVARQGG